MIDGLKPYPDYKDSGVPWLEQVPEHWKVRRLKSYVSNKVQQTDKQKHGDLYLSLEHVEGWTGHIKTKNKDAIYDSKMKRFCAGDVLFSKLRPYLAKVTRPDRDGLCVGEFLVLRPRSLDVDASYIEHLLRSKPIIDAISSSTFGAKMPRADWRFIGGMQLLFPPLQEQAAIIRFLNHADRRIRRYIQAKRRLIALLNEEKRAIIHHAVTRGLNPSIRFKPSGVQWLGEMPEHWLIRKIGSVAYVFNGTTPSRGRSRYWIGGTIPWLSSGKVNDGIVKCASELITKEAFKENSLSIVPKGSTILGLVGQGKTRGMCAMLDIDACINQNLSAIVPRGEIDNMFLYYMLSGYYKHIREAGRGGNQAALNCEIVSMMRFPLPPLSEQRNIVEHLDRELESIFKAQEKTHAEISFIGEFRTRLITDVVTGKLDVREAAAKLPEEIKEAEPVDELEEITEGEEPATEEELDPEALTEAA